MSTHVVQFANGKYEAQTALTYPTHKAACDKHGYTLTVSNKQENPRHPFWEKPVMCRHAIEAGATKVIWLDADTLWTGTQPLDPPLTSILGCTWHAGYGGPLQLDKPTYVYDHFNAGVFYLDATDKAKALAFLDLWENEPDDNHQWHDQHSLNKLIIKDPSIITKLGAEWNSVEHHRYFRATRPIVRAWHGGGGPDNTLAMMSATVKQLSK